MKVQFPVSRMKRPAWLAGLLVLSTLLLAACQAEEIPATGPTVPAVPAATATMAPEPTTAPTEPAAVEEAELSVASNDEYGEFLVGNNGMTLYMFTNDEPNKVNCAGGCLVQWPPLITQGEPVLGEGVDPALVGSAELPDGQMIVTYNEMPLYYWINDKEAGDTTGQAVGDVWWLVSPAGEIIGMDSSAAPEGEGEEAAASEEAEISVSSNDEFGEFLVGNDGMTLYMFTRDEPNMSNCAGDCLVNWPPLLTQGEPVLGEGVDPELVGTAELEDGSMIVTYNGMPLYYWKDDQAAGDTTGQGVGDVWWVVSPEGEIIGMDSGAAAEGEEMAGEEAEISVASNAEFGEFLVGNDGMTLYMFTRDEPNMSNCAGDCLVNWPPLLTQGEPVLGEGVDPELVGTAELEDGSMIVTYNGMPLYYWKDDQAAGDTTGQGVGEVWWLVSPDGEIIGMDGSSTDDASSYTYDY